MNMISSIRDTFINTPKQAVILHKGQIIQGKINTLYPNNKAEIQIGSERLIAEISAPLSVGKKYLFQVQGNDHHIHLKVIGESAKQDATFNIQSLMEQLNLKSSKANKFFLDQLINEKIPFNQKQIEQALQILYKSSNKQETIALLKSMLQLKLPITDAVYQALQSNQTNVFTTLLKNMMYALRQLDSPQSTEGKLLKQLENMLIRPQAGEQTTLLKQLNTSESFLNALKALGLVPLKETISGWKGKVNAYLSSYKNSDHPLETISNSQVHHNNLEKSVQQLLQNSTAIQKEALKIRSIYYGLQNGTLTGGQVESFKQIVQQELIPRLPDNTAQIFHELYNGTNKATQNQLYQLLHILSSQTTFTELTAILTPQINQQDPLFLQQSVQDQFLSHIRNYLQTIGITDEYLLKMDFVNQTTHQEIVNQNQTIKSLLIQLLQGEHGGSSERMQSLLHFINGMQMQSVVEVNNSIQASLVVPGEKLALNKDIFLQFEGQKTKEGQIDAEHCRILFVLHLEHLQETMIDMHVQKRIISVTIYNEHEGPQMESLKSMLHDQLGLLDYHLSNVTWKPLYEKKELIHNKKSMQEHHEHKEKERFDFLI